jgi:hypothetical protein
MIEPINIERPWMGPTQKCTLDRVAIYCIKSPRLLVRDRVDIFEVFSCLRSRGKEVLGR